jgi:hypothetical protein
MDGLYLAIIVILIIMVIFMSRYLGSITPIYDYSDMDYGSYILVTYQNEATMAPREWFVNEVGSIKKDLISMLSTMGSVSCKREFIPLLERMKHHIESEVKKMGTDGRFCQAVQEVIANKGPGHDSILHFKNTLRNRSRDMIRQFSRSDSEVNDQLERLYDDILSNLDAVIHVVAQNLCTIDGRVNLDYIYGVLDQLANMCDVKVQSGLVEPNINWINENVVKPIVSPGDISLQEHNKDTSPDLNQLDISKYRKITGEADVPIEGQVYPLYNNDTNVEPSQPGLPVVSNITGKESLTSKPRHRPIAGSGRRLMPTGNGNQEIEVSARKATLPPYSIPNMMSKIARDDEYILMNGDLNERTNNLSNSVSKVIKKAPTSVIRKVTGSKS